MLSSAYLYSLNIADYLGCTSIAFPLLSSGNNGFDLELALEIAEQSIIHFTGTSLKKVILVIYGNRISELVRSKGYTILEIPYDSAKHLRHEIRRSKLKAIGQEIQSIFQGFLDHQINSVLNFLKDEENQRELLDMAIRIVKIAAEMIRKRK